MKNKKLLKLLATLSLGGVMAVSAFSMAACGKKDKDDDPPDTGITTPDGGNGGNDGNGGNGGNENTATVTGVTVTAAEGATSVEVGKTLQLTAAVAGTNNPAQTVTWESSDTSKATVSGGLVTGVAEGSVTITATSTVDTSKSGTFNLTVTDSSQAGQVTDNAVVPEYKGPAKGPEAGSKSITYKLNGADIEVGTLSADWTNGIFTIASGAEIRKRTPTGTGAGAYSRSIKNGKITVHVPSAGKLKFVFASGSSKVGDASYKLTSRGVAGSAVTINTEDKALNVLEIDVVQGDYIFEKVGGTVDTFGIELTLDGVEATPIQSIELTSAGTSDYLVTQKVDCTGVKLVAKDGSGTTHNVDLSNCKFDTSKYNPDVSGEYEIGVTYYLDSNLSSDKTEFTTSYKVKVYAVDSIVLDLIGLSGNTQLTAQQAYLTTDTYAKENNISVIATCEYKGSTIEYKLKKDWYSITDSVDLSTAGKKTVTVKVDSKYTVDNKEVKATYEIISAAKKTEANGKVVVTVGAQGEFSSVTQAVQYLKKCKYADNVVKVIEIEAGTYTEKVWIDVNNVTLIGKGADKEKTTITCSLVEGNVDNLSGAYWGLNCATVHVTGANFKAYNLTIRNDFDYIKDSKKYEGMTQGAQGVALTLDADGAVLYNCHLYGNQDTLYMKSGRSYYYKTQIDGNVDFIFGGETGLGFFEECKIVAVNRTAVTEGQKGKEQNGYVTAAKHAAGAKKPDYGYIFYNCEMTDDGKVKDGAMSLGRSWGACATVAFIECDFSKAYSKLPSTDGGKDHRWANWSGGTAAVDADFCEFGSTGDGRIDAAVTGGKILEADQAANYTKDNLFGAANGSKVGYGAKFDCDTALETLKILAGLKQGDLPTDPTVTIALKNDVSFSNGNCVSEINALYEEYLTWVGTGSFEILKPENGIKIGTDTVITLKIAGEVSLIAGYELPASDYEITYQGGKATIRFVATTGTYGSYLGGIVVDTSKTMPDTEYVTVTFDYNDEGATQNLEKQVIKGGKVARPADPVRNGYTFDYWYAGDNDSTEFDFDTVIQTAIILKAKWTAGLNATEYSAGSVIDITQLSKTYQAGTSVVDGLELGVLLDASSGKIQPNNDHVILYDGAKIKVKVEEGLTVLPVWHNATPKDGFEVLARDGEGYVTIKAKSGVQTYVMKIMVIHNYELGSSVTIDCTKAEMGAVVQNHYASNGNFVIDATTNGAKFDPVNNPNATQVNEGTIIKIKAPAGVTDVSNVTLSGMNYNETEDITDAYTLGWEDGYIKITAKSNAQPGCYPKYFTITVNAA